MKKAIVLIGLLLVTNLTACTQPEKTIEILSNQGYSNIQIGGYDFTGCGDSDVYATKFTATKDNRTINGVVCSGVFKGSTIRLYN